MLAPSRKRAGSRHCAFTHAAKGADDPCRQLSILGGGSTCPSREAMADPTPAGVGAQKAYAAPNPM